ncbi:MAG: GNAT family N-acetyltransferase [Nocardioides sp.]
MSHVEIRSAREQELEDVGRLTVAAYRADDLLVEGDFYERVLLDAPRRGREAEVLVAVEGEQLLGAVTYCTAGSPWAELAADGEGEFRMLAVDPTARRRGVARALVEACLARSRARGHHAVVISSLPVMTGAHRLYTDVGFVRTPERDWTPAPGVHLWGFRLDIGAGDSVAVSPHRP